MLQKKKASLLAKHIFICHKPVSFHTNDGLSFKHFYRKTDTCFISKLTLLTSFGIRGFPLATTGGYIVALCNSSTQGFVTKITTFHFHCLNHT